MARAPLLRSSRLIKLEIKFVEKYNSSCVAMRGRTAFVLFLFRSQLDDGTIDIYRWIDLTDEEG